MQDEVRRIRLTTGQTVFMITHDVDEAIYLADRIVLMTNGPNAMFAEIVENLLPKDPERADVHRHPLYYAARNHVIDFLITRSKSFADEIKDTGFDRRRVPVVRPDFGKEPISAGPGAAPVRAAASAEPDGSPAPAPGSTSRSSRPINRERTGS
jgi:nitrate/nitrite transport system ATP-binding protein